MTDKDPKTDKEKTKGRRPDFRLRLESKDGRKKSYIGSAWTIENEYGSFISIALDIGTEISWCDDMWITLQTERNRNDPDKNL